MGSKEKRALRKDRKDLNFPLKVKKASLPSSMGKDLASAAILQKDEMMI